MATGSTLLLIGDKSLWLDEGHSVSYARLPWGDLVGVITRRQANMGVYYVLLHWWMQLGESEFFLRSLSAVFAVATVLPVYALGRQLFGARVATAAGFILALNAFFVRYAQEIRGYTLALFLSALATYAFVRAVRRNEARDWVAYCLIGALATYAHFFCGFVIAAHALSLVRAPRSHGALRKAAASFLGIAVLDAPLVLFVLFRSVGQLDWLPAPGLGDLWAAMEDLAGSGTALAAVYLLLAGFALVRAFAPGSRDPQAFDRWGHELLLLCVAVPILVSFALSSIEPIFLARYLIVALPAFVVLVSSGLFALPGVVAKLVAAIVVVVLAIGGLRHWYGEFTKEEWREAAVFVLEHDRPGDGIVLFAGRVRKPFEYYLDLFDAEERAPTPVYPSAPWGAFQPGDLGDPTTSLLHRAVTQHDRIWLIVGHAGAGSKSGITAERIVRVLRRNLVLLQRAGFHRVRIALYGVRRE